VSGSHHTSLQRLRLIDEAFLNLPERYLGAEPGFDATYHVCLGDVGRTWEIRCSTHGARVRRGVTRRAPDVVISTDAETWLALRQGELSGLDAFQSRRLAARGNLDLAIGFEGLFRLPDGRPPLMRMHQVEARGARVSTLTMGEGDDVLLIHGLGGAKSSFFDAAAKLSHRYRVHALDLPGFGSSSKPLTYAYTAREFAKTITCVMDSLGIERAHLVGNSMGGRISIEVGLRYPERVRSLALLCPAVAFVKREFHPIVRMLRPELGLLPHRFTRGMVESQFGSLFCDQDAIDPSVVDVVVDEFQRIYGSAGARLGFLSSARNIYLDNPFGRGGFYPRLSELSAPSLFVWADHDELIPAAFERHVRRWLPKAEQVVLEDCGHVPQVERPEETIELLLDFFTRAEEAEGGTRMRPPLRAAAGPAAQAA